MTNRIIELADAMVDMLCEAARDRDKIVNLANARTALRAEVERLTAEREHILQGWRCECSTDDACRFARERDALAAEAKALRDTKENP